MVHCVNVMLILFSFLLQLRSPGQLFTKRICYVMLGLVLSQKTHIIGAHSHSSLKWEA